MYMSQHPPAVAQRQRDAEAAEHRSRRRWIVDERLAPEASPNDTEPGTDENDAVHLINLNDLPNSFVAEWVVSALIPLEFLHPSGGRR